MIRKFIRTMVLKIAQTMRAIDQIGDELARRDAVEEELALRRSSALRLATSSPRRIAC